MNNRAANGSGVRRPETYEDLTLGLALQIFL